MRYSLLLILSTFFFLTHSFSQWNSNVAINTPVSVQPNDQKDLRIVTDSKGGAIIAWLDFRADATQTAGDIYIQRVDKNGFVKWTVNGTSLCNLVSDQAAPSIVEDGNGGAIIAWNDWRNGNRDIYAQKIDSSGTIQWAANGVAVVVKAAHQQDAKLIGDGAGGAIVVWQDSVSSGEYDVYAQHINNAGVTQWASVGVPVCSAFGSQVNPRIETDGAGGAIIVWQDKRSGTDYDIYAQKLNSSGVIQWTANGISVCSVINTTQSNPKIEPVGSGGAIIAWQDKRNGLDYNICAQYISASGTANWTANGVLVCTAAGSQSAVDMTTDGVSGAVICWKDERAGSFDIYAQKVNLSGFVQWAVNGVGVATGAAQQINPNIVGDGGGGAIIVWKDSTAATFDIQSARIGTSGTVLWSSPVGMAADDQTNPKNVSDGSGGCVFAWPDKRNTADYDIYAHHLNANGVSSGVFEENILVESKVIPNPFIESAEIRVSVPAVARINVYDVFGKVIASDVTRTGNGFIIRRNEMASGIYFYEILIHDNAASKGKLILSDRY